MTNSKFIFWLTESFVPLTLVVVVLYFTLLYVDFRAIQESDDVTVIEIIQSGDDLDQDTSASTLTAVIPEADHPLLQRANSWYERGQFKQAEQAYLEYARRADSSEAYNALGTYYYRRGAYAEALSAFDKALARKPVDATAYFNRALVYSRSNRHREAQKDYERFIRVRPNHFEAHFNLGVAQIKTRQFDSAAVTFAKAASLAGGLRKAKAYYNLGIAYMKSGNDHLTEARSAFDEAIRFRPDYIKARYWRAIVESATPDGYPRALAQLRQLTELKKNYSPAYYRMGEIYEKQRDIDKALWAYQEAIRYNPATIRARYRYGLLLLKNRQWAAAQTMFETILERRPDDLRSRFHLGRALYKQKDYRGAIKQYRQLVKSRKNSEEAYLNIGLAYIGLKDYAGAVAAYKKALEIRPDYPEAWYNLGKAAARHKQYDVAVNAFRKAIKHRPDYASAWFNLGVLLTRQNDEDGAIEAYRRAIEANPSHLSAMLNLAVRLAKKDRHLEAIDLYKRILKLDDTYASAWLNLGIAYMDTGNHDAAELALTRAVELETEQSIKPKRYLARLLARRGAFDQAIEYLEDVVDADPANAALYTELGRVYRQAGRHEQARLSFKKARLLRKKEAQGT